MAQSNRPVITRVSSPQGFYRQQNTLNSSESKPESSVNLSQHKQFQKQCNKQLIISGESEIGQKKTSLSNKSGASMAQSLERKIKKSQQQDINSVQIQNLRKDIYNIRQTFNEQKLWLKGQINKLKVQCLQIRKNCICNEQSRYPQKQHSVLSQSNQVENQSQRLNQSSQDISAVKKQIYLQIQTKQKLIQNLREKQEEIDKKIKQISDELAEQKKNRMEFDAYKKLNENNIGEINENIRKILNKMNMKKDEIRQKIEHKIQKRVQKKQELFLNTPKAKTHSIPSILGGYLPQLTTQKQPHLLPLPGKEMPSRIHSAFVKSKNIRIPQFSKLNDLQDVNVKKRKYTKTEGIQN